MTDTVLRDLDAVFRSPERCVGTVERNTEIKVVLPILVALGWNIAKDIALCFQIDRRKIGTGARAAHAADFALRTPRGLVGIGEGKQWYAGSAAWADGEAQVRRYQQALGLPRAFLTTGRRWLVLGANGEALIDKQRLEPELLIADLRPVLARKSVPEAANSRESWDYGLRPSANRPVRAPRAEGPKRRTSWDPLDYSDSDVRNRVERLISLSERFSLQRDRGKALILRFPSGAKLLEYRPDGAGTHVAWPRENLVGEGVPESLVSQYGQLSKGLRNGKGSFDDLEALLVRIVDSTQPKGGRPTSGSSRRGKPRG
jgi:hypothetical protein